MTERCLPSSTYTATPLYDAFTLAPPPFFLITALCGTITLVLTGPETSSENVIEVFVL